MGNNYITFKYPSALARYFMFKVKMAEIQEQNDSKQSLMTLSHSTSFEPSMRIT
jgi:hypothetical protein